MPSGDPRPSTRHRLQRRTLEREQLLARVRSSLLTDRRVLAAWLFGSIGRGEGDAFSDLDVVSVVADDDLAWVAGDGTRPLTFHAIRSSPRGRFISQVADPLLLLEAPQNAPPGGAFMSSFFTGNDGPLGVDWVWQPMSTARIPPDSLVLFDRRPPSPNATREASPSVGGHPDPPRDPTEVAVHAACTFWSILLWSAKGVARNPYDNMPLLTYATEALQRLERRAPAWAEESASTFAHHTLDPGMDRVRILRAYAEQMLAALPNLDVEIDLPPQVPAQAERLFRLVDEVVATTKGRLFGGGGVVTSLE